MSTRAREAGQRAGTESGTGALQAARRVGERAGSTRVMLGFVLRFGAFWGLALLIMSQAAGLERWMVETTTAHLAFLLRRASVDTAVTDNVIHAGGTAVQIVPDCTPLMPTAVLWAAVIAFPASLRTKLWGVAVGFAVVWVFNLLRVLALIAVLAWRPQDFKFVHVYLWQTGTLLVVCALFILWVRLATRVRARPPGPAGPTAPAHERSAS